MHRFPVRLYLRVFVPSFEAYKDKVDVANLPVVVIDVLFLCPSKDPDG